MSRQADKGNGFLKDKFGDFRADPPPEVWESISNQLGGRKRRRLTLIIISAAASLALAISLGVHYFENEIPGEKTSGIEQKVKETLEEEFPADIHAPDISVVPEIKQETDRQVLARQETDRQEMAMQEGMDQEMLVSGNRELTLPLSGAEATSSAEAIASAEESVGKGEENDAAEKPDNAEEEKTPGDEEALELILDAGDVGDVEMMEDVPSPKEKDPRWVLGAMLSPLYSFRDAEAEALSGTSGQESGMISYATGVQVGYRATRRLAFESGIMYNKMGLSIGAPGIQVFAREELEYDWAGPEMGASPMTVITNSVGNIVSYSGDIYVNNYRLNAGNEVNNVDNILSSVSTADEGIRQHLDYLELPFNLRYTLLDRSFKIQLLGGLSTNFLVNNYVTAETASGTTEIGYLTNLRTVNYSGNAGVGFVYHFLEKLSLNIEPRFRYYLNSVNDATLPSTRPYSFGIYSGLNYFF